MLEYSAKPHKYIPMSFPFCAGLLEQTNKALTTDLPKIYVHDAEGKAAPQFTANNANQSVQIGRLPDLVTRHVRLAQPDFSTAVAPLLTKLPANLTYTMLPICRKQNLRRRSLPLSTSGWQHTKNSAYGPVTISAVLHSASCTCSPTGRPDCTSK